MGIFAQKSWDVESIETAVKNSGSHWFDKESMRFFRTKLYPQVFSGEYGIYFITSESPPNGTRKFSVRKFNPETLSINTCGKFCELTKFKALKNAEYYASNLCEDNKKFFEEK